jgi:phosphodiesterase/alkaline phosphatase D-like protein
VRGGRLENHQPGGDRNVFLLTREVTASPGTFSMRVRLGRMDKSLTPKEGFVGFRVGLRGRFNDYRDSAVRGMGMNTGVLADGRLFMGRLDRSGSRITQPLDDVELRFDAKPAGDVYEATITALDASGKELGKLSRNDFKPDWLTGGIALVAHSAEMWETPGPDGEVMDTGWIAKRATQRGGTMPFWFRDWIVSGSKVAAHDDRTFGPILFTLHTLSRNVMKMTAQMAPVGNESRRTVTLEVQRDGQWRSVAKSNIDAMSRTAVFRIPKWDSTRDTPYRVRYENHTWSGTVRKDPVDKSEIVVAAFTGNNDLGFPHNDIVKHVSWHKPDFLVYTGDNIYERVGEYGVQRAPLEAATLDYLRKWYIYGWEYRELLKDIPAVCLPDDHDVYHGNIWGAGGRAAKGEGQPGQDSGGYTMPAAWVNAVQRTQTSHMADPYDPTPIEQGISVYYGPMLYGGISFAVIEDRKWKSAPKEAVPEAKITNGWPQAENYDASKNRNLPHAHLLGDRQMKFLSDWATDWSGGAWMKAVISQTIFNAVATLPVTAKSDSVTPKLRVMRPGEYPEDEAPVQDHDTNGWPQNRRDEAVRAMRRALAFHIAGDQHLGSTIQYGLDEWNDGGWALCVPSVANIFPRRWYPPKPGANQKPGAPRNTGEYVDGFGNKMTVHAISNPIEVEVEPRALFNRAPGYGIVRFEKAGRKIHMANWARWVDPSQSGAKPYPGWPITISQTDNGLPMKGLSLGAIQADIDNPVVQVTDEGSGEILYTWRIEGRSFDLVVFKPGTYSVRLFDTERKYEKLSKGLKAR